jgi:hypothetical protein
VIALEIGETWYGKDGTVYQGIIATIGAITARNVEVQYNQIVEMDGLQLAGEVMGKRRFQELFEPYRQEGLF